MPDWPHEYTIKGWRPELANRFAAFARLIRERGAIEAWPLPPATAIYHNHYLIIGRHKYWAMGPLGDADPVEGETVLNRAEL